MDRVIFRGNTIRKFLTGLNYENFVRQYEANLGKKFREARQANAQDFAVLEAYKSGTKNTRKLSEMFNISVGKVNSSLTKAALAKI
jgi:hypothetical protein